MIAEWQQRWVTNDIVELISRVPTAIGDHHIVPAFGSSKWRVVSLELEAELIRGDYDSINESSCPAVFLILGVGGV